MSESGEIGRRGETSLPFLGSLANSTNRENGVQVRILVLALIKPERDRDWSPDLTKTRATGFAA